MNDVAHIGLEADLADPLSGSETADEPADPGLGAEEDPFGPLPPGDGAKRPEPNADSWEPILPAPGEPPEAGQIRHSRWGVAVHRWVYRSIGGEPLYAQARFQRLDASGEIKKEVLPYTFGRLVRASDDKPRSDVTGWHIRAPLARRPLYGLDRLAARPDAPVVLTEGEKAADAATEMFPTHVAICSAGGSNAASKADWAPLLGRSVAIWPDRDKAGLKYAASAKSCLREAGANRVAIVDVPANWPEGWDLADPLPESVTVETLAAMLSEAERAAADPEAVTAEFRTAEIDRLSRLPFAEYQATRKLSALDLRLGVTALDKLVKAERAKRSAAAAAAARSRPPPLSGETRWPSGFLMQEDGLYFEGGEDDRPPVWICPPFVVLGEGRDTVGEGWGLWLMWQDADQRVHRWAMPNRLLMVGPGELEGELVDRGLKVSADPGARAMLRRALSGVKSGNRVITVDRPGWHTGADGLASYVLADGTVVGVGKEAVVLRAISEAAALMVSSSGTVESWQQEVAAKAEGNDVAAFCLCVGFAGPMMDVAGETSGGFHIFGRSKVGKTLVASMAVSIWGSPRKGGILRDWRSTANGMELAAAESNDGLLVLDEIHQVEPRDLLACVYMLANEGGKSRARRDVTSARKKTWRLPVLSTGEVDVASVAAKAGQILTAGAQVRLPSLPVDATTMWPRLHEHSDQRALMAALHGGMKRNHGTAGRAFLEALVEIRREHPDELADAAAAMRDRFSAMLVKGSDAQVHEVARRFALMACAGEMAIEWGILPWQAGEAVRVCEAMLKVWLGRRGGGGSTEDVQHLTVMRLFLLEHGSSRFVKLEQAEGSKEWIEVNPERPVVRRAGWRKTDSSGRDHFLVPTEIWKEIYTEAGVDPMEAAKTLHRAKLLVTDSSAALTVKVSIPGLGRHRVYRVHPDLLGESDS